jgi:hypothetical protein
MPQQKQPITDRPKVEDESTGNGTEFHGTHQQRDEALPGSGGDKAGLNKQAARSDESSRSGGGRAQEEHGKRNPKDRRPGSNQSTG